MTGKRTGPAEARSKIPVGTLIKGLESPGKMMRRLCPLGFECFQLSFWESIGDTDLVRLGAELRETAESLGTKINTLSIYGNPLRGDEAAAETWRGLKELIRTADYFGADLVGCFAGRPPGAPVPVSVEPWKRAFSPLAEEAEKRGVRIAFENCRMGDTWKTGKWNIAINPDAWDLMFRAVPSPALGLEWEPCHQVEALADPLAQLREWLPRIIHVHGKDARIDRKLLAEKGLYGLKRWAVSCFPGRGDIDWGAVFSVLREGGYGGTIDIEGWNDEEWSGDREIEGQRRALKYLRTCRDSVIDPH
ncbi:MAG: sugar phosphate isomerase/epimerase [Treponema sp.]|jgi:sugar phosphate isomerase/epimerase|nr:sugar phosphate isomerase/epimerase [Treponema sp.]